MPRRAPQTREMDVLTEFLRRVQKARATADYEPFEMMVGADAVLQTADGETRGADAVVGHLRAMGRERYRVQIVAPKGGLITVLVSPVTINGGWGRSHEQIYEVYRDKVVGLTDLGRTPDMVYRRRSQPN
ncbi:MAG: hypothetical protein V3V35_01235 [Dehalococcoidia bacterium]